MNSRELDGLLRQQVRSFCETFLPNGSEHGNKWHVGNIQGDAPKPGKKGSFEIVLDGPKRGSFYEHNESDRTDAKSLTDVYMEGKGYGQPEFKKAFAELKDWLGVSELPMQRASYKPKSLAKPPKNEVDWKPVAETSDAGKYLREIRGISDVDVWRRYDVGECETWFPELLRKKADGKNEWMKVPAVAFPAWDGQERKDLLMVKYKSVHKWSNVDGEWIRDEEAGHRLIRTNKGTNAEHYHLIGWQAVSPEVRSILIAEGEEDMLSWACLVDPDTDGPVMALSLPMGAKGHDDRGNQWIDNDFERLAPFEDVYLALDGDEPGRKSMEAIAPRIGLERVRLVDFADGEDANSVLLRNPAELAELRESAKEIDPESLGRVKDFAQDIYEEFFPADGQEPGHEMLIGGSFFRFRPGETTLWTGYSKNGKTVAQTHQMVHLANQGEKCCIASLEIAAKKTLKNAMRMAIGREKPVKGDGVTPDEVLFDRAINWMHERFFIYDKVGEVELVNVLEVFRYCARRYGVTQFVIDSLMKLDCPEEDHERQKEVLNQVTAFAREYNVHVHFVAHSKKGTEKRPEERFPPRKHDVLGSVHLTNIPDNVLVIWRNRAGQALIEDLKTKYFAAEASGDGSETSRLEKELDKVRKEKDCTWIVEAQRHGSGQEGARKGWFDAGRSWQYFSSYEEKERGGRVYIK